MKNANRLALAAVVALSAFAAQAGQAGQAGQNFEDGNWPPAAPSTSTLTRAEVLADLQAAQQNGRMPNYDFTYVTPQKETGTVITREQVKAETLATMKEGGLSTGS